MKKLFKKIVVALTLVPSSVFAAIDVPNTPPRGVPNSTLVELIGKVSDTILSIVGVVAVLFLIIGGFQYITSAGNPDSVNKAKATILYAIIGIVVAILAWGIVKFVIEAF